MIFVQQIAGPILQDDWPQGFDYVCGHCGTMVLASCIVDDQIWDLVFQCSGCNGLSASPTLPPGRALPPKPAPLDPGVYPITSTKHLQKCTIVGQAAVDRRLAETGPKGTTFGRLAGRPRPPEGNAAFLEGLIEQVRRLLGGDAFDLLERRESRIRPESKKKRHPLMVVVQQVRSIVATFATSTPTVDDRPVMELVALLQTLERWQRDPTFPTMVNDLGLGNAYAHTAITLAAATLLEDLGNSVEFHQARAGRTPDLRLVIRAQLYVGGEVKAPQVLRSPKGALGYAKLLKVIETEMKHARTGGKGQLAQGQPALLVIGGFHLAASDLRDFERAATAYLEKKAKAGQHRHVMGIGVFSFGSTVVRGATSWNVQPTANMLVAKNPGYEGEVALATAMPPGYPPAAA